MELKILRTIMIEQKNGIKVLLIDKVMAANKYLEIIR